MKFLKQIRITRIEDRPKDAWFDLSLRKLREGEVRFYKVKDFLTGEWLFKVCLDKEFNKISVRALKCPPGKKFAQLEGNTMIFQRSEVGGLLYDVISLTYTDETELVHREIVDRIEDIPTIIRNNFLIETYEKATGKKAPGKHLVTLTNEKDEKSMIKLFLLERAWNLSSSSPMEKLKTIKKMKKLEPKRSRIEIDTGHALTCPICSSKFDFIHIDSDRKHRHRLKKRQLSKIHM